MNITLLNYIQRTDKRKAILYNTISVFRHRVHHHTVSEYRYCILFAITRFNNAKDGEAARL